MADTARRLIHHFGATIVWTELDEDHGAWDGDTRTVTLNPRSCIADQCTVLTEIWRLCAVGPAAAPDLVPDDQPRLRVVEP